jgi:hypothetical protein
LFSKGESRASGTRAMAQMLLTNPVYSNHPWRDKRFFKLPVSQAELARMWQQPDGWWGDGEMLAAVANGQIGSWIRRFVRIVNRTDPVHP